MSVHERSLYITGLSSDSTSVDLETLFADSGSVESVLFPFDQQSGKRKPVAYVVFETKTQVDNAISKHKTATLHEKKLVIAKAGVEHELVIQGYAYPEKVEVKSEAALSDAGIGAMDVSQLQTLLDQVKRQLEQASGNAQSEPRHSMHISIPHFSGDDCKGDLTYGQWRYDVKCLIRENHSSAAILHAIRRSVRGTAAGILPYLGDNCQVDDILNKFDVIFGNVLTTEQLYQDFYAAKQRGSESVEVWGCRLEKMVNELREKVGLQSQVAEEMLRTRFWMGLISDNVRNATRHKFDSGLSFNQLFGSVRSVAHEMAQSGAQSGGQSSKTKDVKSAAQNFAGNVKDPVADQLSKLVGQVDEIKTMVTQIDKRVHQLECNKQPVPKRAGKYSPKKKIPSCERCGRKGHALADCVAKIHVKGFPLKGQAPTSGGRE